MTADQKTESDKKQVLLRLSPALWRDLAAWASDDFRSINSQIEFLLTDCVRRRKKKPDMDRERLQVDDTAQDGVSSLKNGIDGNLQSAENE